jgi:hypothetical protein
LQNSANRANGQISNIELPTGSSHFGEALTSWACTPQVRLTGPDNPPRHGLTYVDPANRDIQYCEDKRQWLKGSSSGLLLRQTPEGRLAAGSGAWENVQLTHYVQAKLSLGLNL